MQTQSNPTTVTYKTIQDIHLKLDIYLPTPPVPTSTAAAVVYFHGGGLTVGNRQSWFPDWLHKRVTTAGHLFICPDYRLLPSGSTTGHEILEDIKDVFKFITSTPFKEATGTFVSVDPRRIAVTGSSSGGLCAYLAAVHVEPRVRGVVSLYGMGGDFLTPHYYLPKTTIFFRGRELLDPQNFSEFTYPRSLTTPIIADSPTAYHPPDSATPGYPSNPRMFLARLYLQLGVYLDYYTGEHGLSDIIRSAAATDPETTRKSLLELIPKQHRILFPCCSIHSSWPPTLFIHGSEDTAVPVHESRYLHGLLQDAGVQTRIIVEEGMDHSFDYQSDAEVRFEKTFDCVMEFLEGCLM